MSVQVISFNCLLKNKAGFVISTTVNREVLTVMQGPLVELAGLAKGLQDIKKGERRTIQLRAEEAYGLYEPKKVILFPRSRLPKQLRVGETISIADKKGRIRVYRVVDFHGDMVSLDGNHPLAGQDLIFEIEALDAREATAEEIEASMNNVSQQLLH